MTEEQLDLEDYIEELTWKVEVIGKYKEKVMEVIKHHGDRQVIMWDPLTLDLAKIFLDK